MSGFNKAIRKALTCKHSRNHKIITLFSIIGAIKIYSFINCSGIKNTSHVR